MTLQPFITLLAWAALSGAVIGTPPISDSRGMPTSLPPGAVQLLGPGVCDFVALDGGLGNWDLRGGVLTATLRETINDKNHLVSELRFRDARAHVEFLLPDGWTGNSGLYFHGLYELQILNSYGVQPLSWREMGSVYRFHKPRVNAARPPKQWQTYDVHYISPRRDAAGKIHTAGQFTAWLNGTPVQINAEFREPRSTYCPMLTTPTAYMDKAHAQLNESGEGPLILQEHLSPVSFRNIWVQPLNEEHDLPRLAGAPHPIIGLIGDSTVADTYGWGPALSAMLSNKAKVINYAKNGGTLQALSAQLDELLQQSPRYVLVQFGHNDQKRYGTAVYMQLLRSYIQRIKEAGAEAIVLSPVTRRNFDDAGRIHPKSWNSPAKPFKDTLDNYASSARLVADATASPFIDLYRLTVAECNALGPQACSLYNAEANDTTHFSPAGAYAAANLVLGELQKAIPHLIANSSRYQ